MKKDTFSTIYHDKKTMDQIIIRNLEVFCNHGVYEAENILGQKFLVDAVLYLDLSEAGREDNLTKSVNYGDICRLLEKEMKARNVKLLEKAADMLSTKILTTFPKIRSLELEVKKPWAPVMRHIDHASVKISRGWKKAYIGAGSNMGDREKYIRDAAVKLHSDEIRFLRMADIIETEPYGYTDQADFLNTVFEIETILSPEALFDELMMIEQEAGRTRELRWGPRTLDLDLLLFDDLVTEDPALVIPHPELHLREFVLKPLCQLNPYGIHPLYQRRFKDLLERL